MPNTSQSEQPIGFLGLKFDLALSMDPPLGQIGLQSLPNRVHGPILGELSDEGGHKIPLGLDGSDRGPSIDVKTLGFEPASVGVILGSKLAELLPFTHPKDVVQVPATVDDPSPDSLPFPPLGAVGVALGLDPLEVLGVDVLAVELLPHLPSADVVRSELLAFVVAVGGGDPASLGFLSLAVHDLNCARDWMFYVDVSLLFWSQVLDCRFVQPDFTQSRRGAQSRRGTSEPETQIGVPLQGTVRFGFDLPRALP